MAKGFFQSSILITVKRDPGVVPKCSACGLHRDCNSPKMTVSGDGEKGILVIAEAPDEIEDAKGTQLIGDAGQLLRKTLRKFDVSLDNDCWITSALICHPPNNRTPTEAEIEYCRPNIIKAIKELQPKVIILLGSAAVQSLLGFLWRESVGPVDRWVGWKIPSQRYNAWVCPIWTPLHILRKQNDVSTLWFERHLEAAVALETRPYGLAVPEYLGQVEVVLDVTRAALILRQMAAKGGTIAFDYETNRLKPDAAGSEIICCSVCWRGEKTIAYPWHGEAIKATDELLKSPAPKIAANLKMEERWTRSKLGHPVRNWAWDTMQAAHILDNRQAISGLKFQAFVQLGQEPWDDHIKPYITGDDSIDINRLREEVSLDHLLRYCGMDSLLEYHLAVKQATTLGCLEKLV